jgi:hypothetical protein
MQDALWTSVHINGANNSCPIFFTNNSTDNHGADRSDFRAHTSYMVSNDPANPGANHGAGDDTSSLQQRGGTNNLCRRRIQRIVHHFSRAGSLSRDMQHLSNSWSM